MTAQCSTAGRRGTKAPGCRVVARLSNSLVVGTLAMVLLVSSSRESYAVSVYLGDTEGGTNIQVEVDEQFQIAVWVVDVEDLAGFQAKVTYSGPVHWSGISAYGTWFSEGHTIFNGTFSPISRSGALTDPTEISGSGDLAIFAFTGDDDGIAAFDLDADYFMLGDTYEEEIEVVPPSTLYVTIGTGGGDGGGEGGGQDETDDDGGGGGILDSGAVYYVDGRVGDDENSGSSAYPFATIAKALQKELDDLDMIVVAGFRSGVEERFTYDENLVIDGLDIIIILSGGYYHDGSGDWQKDADNYETIIDGVKSGPCMKITDCTAGPAIYDFTLTNGTGYNGNGGGIYIVDSGSSSPVKIKDNLIELNKLDLESGDAKGGGIFCAASENGALRVEITGNTIRYNDAKTVGEFPDSAYGGGIYCAGISGEEASTSLTITGNTVKTNKAIRAADRADGGGIYVVHATVDEFRDNSIEENHADGHGGGVYFESVSGPEQEPVAVERNSMQNNSAGEGGGFYTEQADVDFVNNVVVSNNAGFGGGMCICSRPTTLMNNTIAYNVGGFGGGIELSYSQNSTMTNCIVWGNDAEDGAQIALVISSSLTVSYSDVQVEGAENNVYEEEGTTLTWGDGNIDEDPKFAHPPFCLFPGSEHVFASPCIDVGLNDGAPDCDIRGEPRPETPEGRADMGAYEMKTGETYVWPIAADATLDCRVDILDMIFVRNKLNWDASFEDCWRADVNRDGGKINILDMLYVRNRLNNTCPYPPE